VQRTVKADFKRLYSLTEKYQAAAGFHTLNLAKYERISSFYGKATKPLIVDIKLKEDR